jgi:hypothetical protein
MQPNSTKGERYNLHGILDPSIRMGISDPFLQNLTYTTLSGNLCRSPLLHIRVHWWFKLSASSVVRITVSGLRLADGH